MQDVLQVFVAGRIGRVFGSQLLHSMQNNLLQVEVYIFTSMQETKYPQFRILKTGRAKCFRQTPVNTATAISALSPLQQAISA